MIFEIFKIPSRLYSAFLLQKVDDFWQKSMIFDKNPWFLIKNPWLARGPGEIKDFEIIFSHAGQYQKVPQRNIKFPNIKTWLYIQARENWRTGRTVRGSVRTGYRRMSCWPRKMSLVEVCFSPKLNFWALIFSKSMIFSTYRLELPAFHTDVVRSSCQKPPNMILIAK